MTIGRMLCLAAAAVAVAMAAGDQARADSVENGRVLVERNCAMCHAVGRQGKSPKEYAPPFRELSQRYPIETIAESIAEGMLTGHPAMPEFRFLPQEIDDIIAYMVSIQMRFYGEPKRSPFDPD